MNAETDPAPYVDAIPPRVLRALVRHVCRHEGPASGFVEAILAGRSWSAVVARADEYSFRALREIGQWLYNEASSRSWGTEAAVTAWRARHGHDGPCGLAHLETPDLVRRVLEETEA